MSRLLAPLLEVLPLEKAMAQLVVTRPAEAQAVAVVERLMREPVVKARPVLAAGLWLYVDELDRSHTISQAMEDATGSFWHGIMHRREGDFGNSHYWFRRVGHHPAMKSIEGYDPHALIDAAETAHRSGKGSEPLVEMQRREWVALMEWCRGNG